MFVTRKILFKLRKEIVGVLWTLLDAADFEGAGGKKGEQSAKLKSRESVVVVYCEGGGENLSPQEKSRCIDVFVEYELIWGCSW